MGTVLAKPHYTLRGGEVVPKARADSDSGSYSSGYTGGWRNSNKGAGFTRDIRDWNPRRGSADADVLRDLPMLQGRSRDIERNNGVASGVIRTITDNVVGTGFRLVPRPNYLALGMDKAWADAWAVQVSSLWWQWAETTACHAGDTMTFDQLTTQILRGQLLNGGALALPLWLPDRGDGFATKIQTVEIDRLSNPYGEFDSQFLRGGIEFDVYGAPIAYNIRDAHPGDFWLSFTPGMNLFTWTRVPRRTDFGRARVLHIFDPERSAQSRGKPMLSSVLPEFKNIDRYTMAELQAAVVNAMIALVIKTPMEQDGVAAMFGNDFDRYLDARRDHSVKLQSGGVLSLMPGDDAQSFMPQRPASGFGAFLEVMHRVIGLPAGLPYELVMKDFSKTNYSSARAAMLEAWRSFLRYRDWLGTQWCDPIYDLFLEEMVNAGRVDAPNFYDMRAAWTRCRWIGPGRGWVDPTKEAQAAQVRMASFITTLEDECAEAVGGDWREKLDQAAVEREYKISKGLPPDLVVQLSRQVQEHPATDTAPGSDSPGSPGGADETSQAAP